MDRRRLTRALPRRTTAGVAAFVAAVLGFTLLGPEGRERSGTGDHRPAQTIRPLDEDAAQRQARRTGKRVEVTSLRDATSSTYALSDGSFELTSYAAPIRAKVGDDWRPIDTALTRTKHGWAPRAAADPVIFSAGTDSSGREGHEKNAASGPRHGAARQAVFTVSGSASAVRAAADDGAEYSTMATLASDGHRLTVEWPGPLPEPVIDGASALYRSVFDGVDLLLTARDSGFSHVLVVHSPAAAANPRLAQLSYRLSSPDLTFHLDPVTRTVTAKDSEGTEIAVSPTPYMWDSSGKPAVTPGADPVPAEPAAEPSPSFSEEPGAAASDNPAGSDSDDTAAPPAPETTSTPSRPASPEAPGPSSGATVRQSAYGADTTPAEPGDVLGLPGLLGPQPGTRTAVGGASLTGQGSTSATLAVAPDQALLSGKNTTYPVFIDPSITGKTKNWTTAYKKHPTSSFYDGANYNSGTTEARAGYESSTGGLSRSFFRLGWTSSFKGATVTSASIRLLETYSWSCSAREMQLWHTGGISSSTTWNNQPSWTTRIGTKSFANGYSSSCPDAYVTYDARSVAQSAANGGWTNFTIGLRASTEDSSYSWKKFKAEGESAPKITIVYNRKPAEPTRLTMTPGPDCDTTSPYSSVGLSDLTFAAHASDPDGNLKYLDFEVWQSGSTSKIYDANRTVDSAGNASVALDGADGTASSFVNGRTYFWQVRAIDSSGAASTYGPPGTVACGFVYDSSAPNSPSVTSTVFPEDDGNGTNWSTIKFGTAGAFTFGAAGSPDTVKYLYSFNTTQYDRNVTVTAGGSATVSLKPTVAGPNILYVKAVDSSGNTSPTPTKYLHYVTPRDTSDAAGDVTGDAVADLYVLDATGDLRLYPATSNGDIHVSLQAAHKDGVSLEADLDEDGVSDYGDYWLDSAGKPALISHNGDFLPGDGIQDLVARMGDGKLYVYRGDGYGSVDIEQRTELRLPAGAPDPSTYSQILAVGDITGDNRPELFVTSGDALWALTGYTGGTFASAVRLSGSAWTERDLVNVGDVNSDGSMDLVYRTFVTDRLLLRLGKPDSGGGTSLGSLANAADSLTGVDTQYGTGWSLANIPLMTGTPDATGDGIPDIWALISDGTLRFYKGTAASGGSSTTVISGGWESKKGLG